MALKAWHTTCLPSGWLWYQPMGSFDWKLTFWTTKFWWWWIDRFLVLWTVPAWAHVLLFLYWECPRYRQQFSSTSLMVECWLWFEYSHTFRLAADPVRAHNCCCLHRRWFYRKYWRGGSLIWLSARKLRTLRYHFNYLGYEKCPIFSPVAQCYRRLS